MHVKWGIVSTAHINRLFLAGAREADGVQILAVASRDRQRAEEYARENGIERAYGSYDALLADPDVEAIYISLPNSMHIDMTVRALEAGKHVLCEKPLSRRTEEVERAFDVAERHGRLLMEAFMYRHNPQTRRLTELVAEGAVGRVRIIRAAFGFVARDPANVRLSGALDGGALMDVGCYCVSGSRLIAGEPVRVMGEQALGGDGVDVAFAAVMRFADDITAHFDAGLALASRDLLEVVGDEGTLRLTDPWHCRRPGIDILRENADERIEIAPVNSYRLEAENLSAAIRGEAPLLLGRADAIGQARAIEALYAAAESGSAVTLAYP
jgi:D-xylose 1-dehydrogenase (NADP+, D-xylono-1,5-lactone-forming)